MTAGRPGRGVSAGPRGADGRGDGDRGGSFESLAGELKELFGRGVDAPLDDASFGRWALAVFRHQVEANPVYRRFCEGRGATVSSVSDWREIPAVPTTAFRELPLLSGPPGRVEAVFRTSGTTSGAAGRGEHRVPDLSLYRAAALPNLAAHLLPEAAGRTPFRIPFLCLLPSPEEAPDSSLSAMAGFAAERWGADSGGWFVDPRTGLRAAALDGALRRAEAGGRPVLVLGTAFSLVHWLDAGRPPARLPPGSRIMETGGFKGRSRSVPRSALYAALEERLGVPASRIVNEYGMTELLSQFWEPVLRGGGPRRHVGPPWVRTRVLDPRTLEPVPDGQAGLLCHLDLANLGSVACVLTEDLGERVDDGFRVLGRAQGAEPRGCSLAMEELMEAAGAPP